MIPIAGLFELIWNDSGFYGRNINFFSLFGLKQRNIHGEWSKSDGDKHATVVHSMGYGIISHVYTCNINRYEFVLEKHSVIHDCCLVFSLCVAGAHQRIFNIPVNRPRLSTDTPNFFCTDIFIFARNVNKSCLSIFFSSSVKPTDTCNYRRTPKNLFLATIKFERKVAIANRKK